MHNAIRDRRDAMKRHAPQRRAVGLTLLAGLAGVAGMAGLGACTTAPLETPAPAALRPLLAPGGRLRVGVYAGSPTSLVRAADGSAHGLTVEVGEALARRLGASFDLVEFPRVAAVLEAMQSGAVDFTVTNASPERAALVDFTPPLFGVELGYLSLPGSPVQALQDVDRPGMRIGVSQGSSSQGTLTRQFKAATVVPAPSLQVAAAMLQARQVDAYATNKGIMFELADGLPGARVLEGRWGVEHLAIAVPRGRAAAMDWLRSFAAETRDSGLVQRAAARAGLRGTVAATGG
jgi:polar amino acid transport system substrate-binding protein